MSVLTKSALAESVADRLGISRARATDMIDVAAETIVGYFQAGGHRATLQGFGTFTKRRREEFSTDGPGAGKRITVPARNIITFKQSRDFKSLIN